MSLTCSTMEANLPRASPHSSSRVMTALPSLMTTRLQFTRSERNMAWAGMTWDVEMLARDSRRHFLWRDWEDGEAPPVRLEKAEIWLDDELVEAKTRDLVLKPWHSLWPDLLRSVL